MTGASPLGDLVDRVKGCLADYLAATGTPVTTKGSQMLALCPLHDDSRPSLRIQERGDVQVWYCFPCGCGGDIIDLHGRLNGFGERPTGTEFVEVLHQIADVLGEPFPEHINGSRVVSARPTKIRPQRKSSSPHIDICPTFDALHRKARARLYNSDQLLARFATELGVREETLHKLTMGGDALGFSPMPRYRKDRKWKSCHPDRLLYLYPTGAKVRHPFGPESNCRFLWSIGRAALPWRAHLLERDEIQRVYLCEGESDAIALIDAGVEIMYPDPGDVGTAVVASPGTSFDESWAELFQDMEVVLCFDTDDAGRKAAMDRVARMLYPKVRSLAFVPSWNGGAA